MARTRPSKQAMRYAVPVAVAGVAVASIGLVPALADNGDPDLPDITAQELVAKIAESDTEQLSGTVKVSTDLGIPDLSSLPGAEKDKGAEGDADPRSKLMELVSGEHTLKVAMDSPDKHRVDILDGSDAEYSLVHNDDEVWAYESASNSVFHATAPEDGKSDQSRKAPEGLEDLTPQEFAKQTLAELDDTTSVTVDGTTKVAGRDAYQLALKPKGSEAAANSTIDAVRIAVDADNGVPLRFTVDPKGGGKAAVDVGYTEVDFSKPDAGTFDFKPPKGAKVTEADELEKEKPEHGDRGDLGELEELEDLDGLNIIGEGWDAVAEIKAPEGADAEGFDSAEANQFLDSFTEKAEGDFGTGRVFSTRVVNVLMTDDGAVYAGAVTKDGLIKAANER